MSRTSSREAILNAAEEVVLEVGATHMTLDAVARKAGISKGGLIYNFPSKMELLKAMLERFAGVIEASRRRHELALKPGPSRVIKAQILSMFKLGPKERRTAVALLAGVSNEPGLLDTVRERRRELTRTFTGTGLTRGQILTVLMAAEGILLSKLLGLSTLNDREERAAMKELLRLIDEWSEGGRGIVSG